MTTWGPSMSKIHRAFGPVVSSEQIRNIFCAFFHPFHSLPACCAVPHSRSGRGFFVLGGRQVTSAAFFLLPVLALLAYLLYVEILDARERRQELAMWEDLMVRVRRGDFDGGAK